MQTWQRDRMRRRKRKGTPEQSSSAPPPLQPFYPGMQGENPPAEEPREHVVERPAKPEIAEETQPTTEPRPAAKKRGRRGGRGRRPGKAATQPPVSIEPGTPTGEAAEITVPEPQEDLAEPGIDAEVAAALAETEPHAEAPAPAAAAKTSAKTKGAVVLAIGLPGSGKSTWFKRREITPLSSDLMRHLLFDNVQEQRHQDLVFSTLRSLLRARLLAHMPWNYVDATNLSPKERRHWVRMAHDFGYEVHAVYFDVPLEVCMERNEKRQRVVPTDVMQRMSAKLRPPTFEEGFSKITVVRVKQAGEPKSETD